MQSSSPERETVERLAEEFVERYRRGEHPPLTEYTERYPEHAEQIRDLFPALVMMEQIAPDSGSDSSSLPTSLGQQTNVQPKQIGDYRILREIGRGGMGIVYEAEQVSLGRHVALKVLPQQFVPNSKQRQRFEREARSAAKLHHTNIVPVFGVGEENGLHYYVMQFIHGLGLDAVLDELRRLRRDKQSSPPGDGEIRVARRIGQEARRDENGVLPPKDVSVEELARSFLTGFVERPGMAAADQGEQAASPPAPVPAGNESQKALSASSVVLPGQSGDGGKSGQSYWHSVAHVGVQVAGALAYAHQQGVLHRDIKPANLLLDTQGTVWVTDFGLAKIEDQHNLTHTGDMVGTLRYMAPEIFNGKADERSEVYALGLTLYEMLALRPAFDEKDRHQLLRQVITAEPSGLDKLNSAIPRDLVTIVHKAIDRDPEHRYQNARELAEDLEHFLAGEPVRARPAGLSERALKWARRRPAVAALLGVIALSLVCLLGGTLWHNAQLGAANIQLNDALLTSEKRRLDADTNLYHSLVGEARALRRARDNGYRGEIFKRLAHALQLRTPDKDPLDLRQEAAACLGDFVGFDPVIWEDFPTGMECAALHPDGTELAVGLVDGTVVLRHIPSGAHLTRLTGHVSAVSFVTFRADGKELISTDLGGMIKVWHANDTGTWTCTRTTLVEPLLFLLTPSLTFPYFTPSFTVRTIDSAGLTPDGQYMAVSCVIDSTIILVDLAKGTTAARFVAPEGEQIWTLALSPDGKVLAGGYAHQGTFGVLLWDVATGALVRRLLPNLEQTIEVRFSPNGKLLACLHSEGLALYDTSSFQHPQFVRGDLPYSIAFSPDSHVLAIDVWQLGLVRLWNVYTSRETAALRWQGTKLEKPSRDSRSWHGPRMLKAMEFSKDGKIFVAATGYSVHLWNLAGGSEKLVLRGHAGGVPDVVFSPDGKLLASAGKDHTIKIWDPVAGTLLKTLTEFSTPVQTLGFSPDGRILAAGDFERDTVRFYDVPSWKELAVMHPQVGSIVASVGFSPDGKYFAAAGWTGLTLWRIVPGKTDQSGESKFTLQHHGRLAESPSVSVCFSADSNWLAWLSWDEAEDKIRYGQIHFTDLRSPQPRRLSAAGSWNGVLALGFYPDCQHLVFVSDKRAITVWDVSSNQESFSFGKEELERLSTKPVARLSADGAWYAMGSQTVTIWDMRTRKLLVALPEERSAVSSVGWSPNRELLAVGTFGGGPIIWNLSKVKAKLDEIGLGW